MITDFTGCRVLVMGLGRLGGGAGVVRWLVEAGAKVILTDLASADALAEPLGSLGDLLDTGGIELHLGGHWIVDFTACDLVIANPAVSRPWENKYLCAAASGGVPITTEIRLLTERLDQEKVIGVTGTAGKSTTAAMIHHVLTRSGQRSHLGGNIGGSLLTCLDQIYPGDHLVLELSSAMLYWLGDGIGFENAPGWSPHIAVLTNLRPNHLDWHGSFEHYHTAKQNIFRYQESGEHAITVDNTDPAVAGTLHLPGRHNQTNARLAYAAATAACAIDQNQCETFLSGFPGLPHRLQCIGDFDNYHFYDDSKSTTPESTVLAVDAFELPGHIHLIVGGYDKGSDLTPIAELVTRVASLYTIGTTGPAIARSARRLHEGDCTRVVFECETLECAMDMLRQRLKPDDIVLLSPGCASWDQFKNYQQRGKRFAELASHLNFSENLTTAGQ